MSLDQLSRKKRLILLSIHYAKHRTIKITDTAEWLHQEPSYLIDKLFNQLSESYNNDFADQSPYLKYAEALLQLLPDIRFSHDTNAIELSENIGVPPKTLLRACNAIFGMAPKNIIRYHLLSKSIYMLLHEPDEIIGTIASKLAFKELTTFN